MATHRAQLFCSRDMWNSNPAVIAADQQRVIEGLRREDLFTFVHDQFVTGTARYADIVLPATTMMEHPDLVGSWGFSYLSWNEAVIDPVGESKSNAEGHGSWRRGCA